MPSGPLLAPALLLATVLVISGVAKVRSSQATRDAMLSLRLPAWLRSSPAPVVLPWAELVLALALIVTPAPWALVPAGLALLLMLVYVGLIGRALTFDEPVTCSCFGELGLGLVTRRTLWRNLALTLAAALAVVGARAEGSVVTRLLDAGGETWLWLAMAALVAVVVLLAFGERDAPSPGARLGEEPVDGELDYVRHPIPYGVLVDGEGTNHSLAQMTLQGAVLLVFVSLGCGPCGRVMPKIPEWAEQLGPVGLRAVTAQTLDSVDDLYAYLRPFLMHDPQMTLLRTFSVANPGAVLLGADGLLAGGPVLGEVAVTEFVEDVIEQLRESAEDEPHDDPPGQVLEGEIVGG